MPLVKDETEIKQDSLFPKYQVGETGNLLILKSHLYKIDIHFIPAPIKRSVLCPGDSCEICKRGKNSVRSEFNYFVELNGSDGFMDVKPSVFFNIQGISKAQKKDPRQISWTVIKTGEGLGTEYTTSKCDNLTEEQYQDILDNIDINTQKLEKMMESREENLQNAYNEIISRFQKEEIKEIEPSEDVDPDEVPF